MKASEMRDLFAFNAWANQRILAAVDTLSAEQFTKDMGSSFKSVRDTLVHIWGVEWIWLERLKGNSPSAFPEAKDFPDLATLRPRWSEVEKNWEAYVGGLDDGSLEEDVKYMTMTFGPSHSPRWQMLQHVVNHSTYHRGQVTTMLRQLGTKSAGTDLIFFYRERQLAANA
jgi:uncharacterized damage-inducible protein DinB